MFGLSAAYDMLPVNVIMPQDKDQMALTVNGKKRDIRQKDFLVLADIFSGGRISLSSVPMALQTNYKTSISSSRDRGF